MTIKGGQPKMDQGLRNFVNMSLFTGRGWYGNYFIRDENQKIGSDFIEKAEQPITTTSLNNTRLAAEKALENPVAGKIEVTVDNPEKNFLNVLAKIQPPGSDVQELKATRNGANWQNQAIQG
jgi:phage gp46-like protein